MKSLIVKREVYVTYADDFKTWNIIDVKTNKCIGYGSIEETESFLLNHRSTYFEQLNIVH